MTGAEQTPDATPEQEAARPLLQVVKGDPTPEELAALVAVVAAAAGSGGAPAPRRRPSDWASRARQHRTPVHASYGGWRASGLPR